VVAGPIFVAIKFRTWLASSAPRITLRSAFAWIVVLALPLVLISTAPLGSLIAMKAEGFAKEMSRENYERTEQKTELRLDLWKQAIVRGVESGMLGLGPGPHLEIPSSILTGRQGTATRPKYVEHPEPNFAPNFEAHNTLLDLFIQGGLIAVLSFVWLAATALFITYRARLAGLSTLLCGLAVYGVATLIIRHPIFWFAIALCLVAGTGAVRPSVVRDWSQ
jgi:O-antigen ligase